MSQAWRQTPTEVQIHVKLQYTAQALFTYSKTSTVMLENNFVVKCSANIIQLNRG